MKLFKLLFNSFNVMRCYEKTHKTSNNFMKFLRKEIKFKYLKLFTTRKKHGYL